MLRKFNIIAAALILCAGLAAYSGSFSGPFVLDDTTSITGNPTIRHLWPLTDVLTTPRVNVTVQSRPVLNLSLAFNYALSGYNVSSYHVFNLLIHLLAALCVFGIIRRTLFSKTSPLFSEIESSVLALAISLIWVVHPLNTESVTYVIQRAESLTALFLFLSLYCSLRYFDKTARANQWALGAVVTSLLGMATKEVMVVAPVLILIYDRCFCSGSFRNALKLHVRLYLGLFLTWILLIILVIQSGGNRGGSIGFGIHGAAFSYLATQGEAIYRYLILSFWPHPLVFEYGAFKITDFRELAPWLFVLPLIILSFRTFFKKPKIGFLGAWFFIILSPTSLVPGTSQMIVEHRMYMPLLAVLTFSIIGLYTLFKKSIWFSLEFFLIGIFSIAFIFSLLTYQRNITYRSSFNLWNETLKERPDNPLAHFMIAEEYLIRGEHTQAGEHYYKAVTLSPSFIVAHERFGEYLLSMGNFVEAQKEFENALALSPDFADAYLNLGSLLARNHKPEAALPYLKKASSLEPNNSEARYNLANTLVMLGKYNEAYTHYTAAIHFNPNYSQAYYNWGNALFEETNYKEAIEKYAKAVILNPAYYLAEYNEGNAYVSLHLFKDAALHYNRALKINPSFAFAELNLGSVNLELNELGEAEYHFKRALSIDPTLDEAKENLRRIELLNK